MAFGDYVRVLRTYWRSVLAATVLGIAVGGGSTLLITPQYTATAQVLFTANAGDGGGQDLAFGATYVQGRMINYADLVTREFVLGPVISELDLDQTPKQLGEHVTAEFAPTSTILTMHVEDESKAEAAEIASAVAQSLITQVAAAELQAPVIDGEASEPRSLVTGQLVAPPTTPDSRSSPNLQLHLVAGAMFGLIAGLAVALVRFVRSTREPKAPKPPKPPKAPKEPKAPKPPKQADNVATVPPPPPPPPPPANPDQTPLQPAPRPQNPKRPGRRTRR